MRGLLIACAKRPITPEKIDGLITSIEAELRSSQRNEIKSRDLGDLVLARCWPVLDDVAYIRFASVYKDFQNVEEFSEALERAGLIHGRSFQAARRDPGSARLRPSGRCGSRFARRRGRGATLPFERALVRLAVSPWPFPRAMRGSSFPEAAWRHEQGISIVNAPGLIDSGYRGGDQGAAFINLDPTEVFNYEKGERIAQLVIIATPTITLHNTYELPAELARSAGLRKQRPFLERVSFMAESRAIRNPKKRPSPSSWELRRATPENPRRADSRRSPRQDQRRALIDADLKSARTLSTVAAIAGPVSFIIGGVMLSTVGLVCAIVGFVKIKHVIDDVDGRQKVYAATVRQTLIWGLAISAIALIVNIVGIALMMPVLMEAMQTGDFTSILGEGAAITAQPSGGSGNAWG